MIEDVRIETETLVQPNRIASFVAGENPFLARYKAIQARIAEALGEPPLVIYTGYPVVDDLPVDNLDEVAVTGRCRFEQPEDCFWQGHECYQSDVMENPTWLQVACLANEMIRVTGDDHRLCFRRVRLVPERQDGEIMTYEFLMGSS